MSDEPKKLFDLMDIETEPTDDQLEQLMHLLERKFGKEARGAKQG